MSKLLNNDLNRGNKPEIVGWGMPDYNAGIAVTLPYTANQYGLINVKRNISKLATINGIRLDEPSSDNKGGADTTIPIGPNDTIDCYGNSGATFFPMKGVNNA